MIAKKSRIIISIKNGYISQVTFILTDISDNTNVSVYVHGWSIYLGTMNSITAEQRLRNRKIQPTAMRLRVLNYLAESKAAVGLNDLEEYFIKADRTTLYRTLKTFLEQGLVHQINDASGTAKYALCAENCTCSYPDDIHLHFYCSSCEQTFCFTHLGIPPFELPDRFTPSHANFVITGKCPNCTS